LLQVKTTAGGLEPSKELDPMRKKWIGAVLTAGLLTGACSSNSSPSNASTTEGASATSSNAETIPQPTVGNFEVAPESKRVDIVMPTFSDPTNVTNPLFPVSKQESVLLLGQVDGKAFRTEVTLLPETRIIEWAGQKTEVLVSQYAAYLDGRIEEVAYDFYAQADDGSVWYFGEDVFNFVNGAIANTHGTWIAGNDGPAAMIMPADPKVGDVYRPENIPGFVFEEVTVKGVDQRLPGPLGPVDGGLLIEELHMDGGTEDKTFAPDYGEFYTAGGGDVEAMALAVPTDALSEETPQELRTLRGGATGIFDAAASGAWNDAAATSRKMAAAWESYRRGEIPKRIEPRMTAALSALADAIDAKDTAKARQAAIDTAQWALDLQLRYRPPVEIDLARFDLWLEQLLVDSSAGDAAAVNGDFFSLDYIRDRILHVLKGSDVLRINSQLETLYEAVAEEDLDAAASAAKQLRQTMATVQN
jgi:hypothetical protein